MEQFAVTQAQVFLIHALLLVWYVFSTPFRMEKRTNVAARWTVPEYWHSFNALDPQHKCALNASLILHKWCNKKALWNSSNRCVCLVICLFDCCPLFIFVYAVEQKYVDTQEMRLRWQVPTAAFILNINSTLQLQTHARAHTYTCYERWYGNRDNPPKLIVAS